MTEDLKLTDTEEDVPRRGVGGLLLGFCLVLVVGVPFTSARVLVDHYNKASSDIEYIEGLGKFLLITLGIRLFVAIFSMHAGMALWTERPGALRTAKAFLWTMLGALCLGVLLLFLLPQWPEGAMAIMWIEAIREVIPTLLFFTASYSYLTWSRRVRATYID